MKKSAPIWAVYLLVNEKTGRTYVGSTTDVKRRCRQHNGEIRGGARATRKGGPTWRIYCYLSGFRNRSEACRWEALIKKRSRGLLDRTFSFCKVYLGECPPGRKHYTPPRGLEILWLAK